MAEGALSQGYRMARHKSIKVIYHINKRKIKPVDWQTLSKQVIQAAASQGHEPAQLAVSAPDTAPAQAGSRHRRQVQSSKAQVPPSPSLPGKVRLEP